MPRPVPEPAPKYSNLEVVSSMEVVSPPVVEEQSEDVDLNPYQLLRVGQSVTELLLETAMKQDQSQ